MAKTCIYRQCTLRKQHSESESSETVGYLPDKFARLNRVLRLESANGTWDDGWVVKHVGAEVANRELPDIHKSIKNHLMNTGDKIRR
jgi:hypothetical protein